MKKKLPKVVHGYSYSLLLKSTNSARKSGEMKGYAEGFRDGQEADALLGEHIWSESEVAMYYQRTRGT
jgi:hypothetical protein